VSVRVAWLIAAALVCLAVAGCRPAAAPAPVPVVDEQQFAAVLAENRGKVILVDFWATWCGPCRELFPHTVELHRRYADRGLAVLSVSVDDPSEQAEVGRFLASQGARFPSFISRYGTGSRSVEAFEIGEGAIPYVKLYDREGRLYKAFGGGAEELNPERIEAAIKELLSRRSA